MMELLLLLGALYASCIVPVAGPEKPARSEPHDHPTAAGPSRPKRRSAEPETVATRHLA
jgi:hypothetical protein